MEVDPHGGDHELRDEHDSSSDLPTAQLLEHFVGFGEGPGTHVTANLRCGGHGQDVSHIFARANRRGMDVNLAAGHKNRRKADIFGGQANHE